MTTILHLLGVHKVYTYVDANDITDSLCVLESNGNVQNVPATWCVIIHFGNGVKAAQICISYADAQPGKWWRKRDGTWSAWAAF